MPVQAVTGRRLWRALVTQTSRPARADSRRRTGRTGTPVRAAWSRSSAAVTPGRTGSSPAGVAGGAAGVADGHAPDPGRGAAGGGGAQPVEQAVRAGQERARGCVRRGAFELHAGEPGTGVPGQEVRHRDPEGVQVCSGDVRGLGAGGGEPVPVTVQGAHPEAGYWSHLGDGLLGGKGRRSSSRPGTPCAHSTWSATSSAVRGDRLGPRVKWGAARRVLTSGAPVCRSGVQLDLRGANARTGGAATEAESGCAVVVRAVQPCRVAMVTRAARAAAPVSVRLPWRRRRARPPSG